MKALLPVLLAASCSAHCALNPFHPSDTLKVVFIVETRDHQPLANVLVRATTDGHTRDLRTNAAGRTTIDVTGDTELAVVVMAPGFIVAYDSQRFDPRDVAFKDRDFTTWSFSLSPFIV